MDNKQLLERIALLEQQVKTLMAVNDVQTIEKIRKVIFNKRSNTLASSLTQSYPVIGGAVTALKIPDGLQEVIIDGQRNLIPTYNG